MPSTTCKWPNYLFIAISEATEINNKFSQTSIEYYCCSGNIKQFKILQKLLDAVLIKGTLC